MVRASLCLCLSLIVSLFLTHKHPHISQATSDTTTSLSQVELDEIRQAFRLFDTEGRGKINAKELKGIMESLALESDAAKPFLDNLDKGPVVELDIHAFSNLFVNGDNANDLNHIFGLFDTEKKGYISKENLTRVAENLGENMTDAELQEMMDRAGKNGKVHPDEFHNIMTKKLFS
jgi:centrin-1